MPGAVVSDVGGMVVVAAPRTRALPGPLAAPGNVESEGSVVCPGNVVVAEVSSVPA